MSGVYTGFVSVSP